MNVNTGTESPPVRAPLRWGSVVTNSEDHHVSRRHNYLTVPFLIPTKFHSVVLASTKILHQDPHKGTRKLEIKNI